MSLFSGPAKVLDCYQAYDGAASKWSLTLTNRLIWGQPQTAISLGKGQVLLKQWPELSGKSQMAGHGVRNILK